MLPALVWNSGGLGFPADTWNLLAALTRSWAEVGGGRHNKCGPVYYCECREDNRALRLSAVLPRCAKVFGK